MKIIYNNLLPFRNFEAVNLCGFIFARKQYCPLSERAIIHERIHTEQMKEMLFLFFYIWYLIEWLIRFIHFRNALQAYYAISFEKEAYENQYSASYLKKRKWGSFLNYL